MFFYSVLGYLVLGGYYAFLAVLLKNSVATIGVGFMGVYMQMCWEGSLRAVGWAKEEPFLLKVCFMYQLNQFLDWETFQDGFYMSVMVFTFLLTFSEELFFYVKSDFK